MFKLTNNKLVHVCPGCGKNEFKEPEKEPTLKIVGDLQVMTPLMKFYECINCGFAIIDPESQMITSDEADMIVRAFSFLFDEQNDLENPEPVEVYSRYDAEDVQSLRNIFLRVLNPSFP